MRLRFERHDFRWQRQAPRATFSRIGERLYPDPRDRLTPGLDSIGGVPEWLKGTVSKTVWRVERHVGSNPTLSAEPLRMTPL